MPLSRRQWMGGAALGGLHPALALSQSAATPPPELAPAPLIRDPIYDGAADPTIIWNPTEKTWWIFYTNRRANAETRGVAWCHGTDIGIASSADGGKSWDYRGIAEGLKFERGTNTFWAPELLWHDGTCHMYFSYVRGVPYDWSGERHIVHATSRNLWDWKVESILALSSDHVIDACVEKMPGGQWRMWHKDERNGSHTYAADSQDLYHWRVTGPVITDVAHEGPNVFKWLGSYWMITDHWKGIGVYRSEDAEHWSRGADILKTPGTRPDDATLGHHADVLVQGDRAYIFYFTHPEAKEAHGWSFDDVWPYSYKRTSLQVAELALKDGWIVCDRNRPFSLKLEPA